MKAHILIDKFIVPSAAKEEFYNQVRVRRAFIKSLPGFIADHAYEQLTTEAQFSFVTVVIWENEEAFINARQAATAAYEKQGFDLAGMLKRLNIQIDRASYQEIDQ
ncbi:antibiotic biosynthesis monooxygenase [Chitinophaga sp. MM2321]|uniref:antibiotic biosynthesis monooxygenase family protein n=1 Tax=Chitinophaga sp. MM2321 TaxID=3137178 RepID=UPI0032D58236